MNDTILRMEDIITALGYRNTSASEEILRQAEETVSICTKLIEAKAVYRRYRIVQMTDDEVILETGDRLSDPLVTENMKNCTHVLMAIATVGAKIDRAISEAFQCDDYLTGMMLDAAGSAAVSNYSKMLWQTFIELLNEGEGMTQGFAPGEKGWSITEQRVFFKLLDAESIDVELNDSCLMLPSKSISIVYGIGMGIPVSRVGHSCEHCELKNCMMRADREVHVLIHHPNGLQEIKTKAGASLLEIIRANGIFIDATCSGRGTCGACKARFVKLLPKITEADRKHLSSRELNEGWRLTCMVEVQHPLELWIEEGQNIKVLGLDAEPDAQEEQSGGSLTSDTLGVAVDIGTTTIAAFLVDTASQKVLVSTAQMNRQRQYGADVASRILYGMTHQDGNALLHQTLTTQLNEMILHLMRQSNVSKLDRVITVGNTVMAHFLLGYDTQSLGVAPYTPVSLKRTMIPCSELGMDLNAQLTMMEGIAAYVGSDITVGAAYCELMEHSDYTLLIDLGTNGEIALGNKEHLFCCSTAAGPAFEAANIQSGMGGLPGAVSKCSIEHLNESFVFHIDTIDNLEPKGICGSGVLDITSELVRVGMVEHSGRMSESEYIKESEHYGRYVEIAKSEKEEIVFTQKDIREVQLAKAAVAGGIRVLLKQAGIGYEAVKEVCVAGGFGSYMNVRSALAIGLLPRELKDKVVSSGNTAGKGAVRAMLSSEFCDLVDAYGSCAEYIELATNLDFQTFFIEEMEL